MVGLCRHICFPIGKFYIQNIKIYQGELEQIQDKFANILPVICVTFCGVFNHWQYFKKIIVHHDFYGNQSWDIEGVRNTVLLSEAKKIPPFLTKIIKKFPFVNLWI